MALPEKTYKISQAAKLLDVKPYVLRFWESEVPELAPSRTPTGQRVYTEEQIDLIRRFKHLLYDQGLTIEGAKRALRDTTALSPMLQEIKKELLELRMLLSD